MKSRASAEEEALCSGGHRKLNANLRMMREFAFVRRAVLSSRLAVMQRHCSRHNRPARRLNSKNRKRSSLLLDNADCPPKHRPLEHNTFRSIIAHDRSIGVGMRYGNRDIFISPDEQWFSDVTEKYCDRGGRWNNGTLMQECEDVTRRFDDSKSVLDFRLVLPIR